MEKLNSFFIDYVNEKLLIFQKISDASFLDKIILVSVLVLLFLSLFSGTSMIGGIAFISILLTLFKIIFFKDQKLTPTKLDGLIVLYLIFVAISVVGSSLLSSSLGGFFKTITYFGFFFSVKRLINDRIKYAYILITFLAICISTETVLALLQNVAGVESLATWQDTSYCSEELAIDRLYGTLQPYNPNLLGGYLLIGLPFLICFNMLQLVNKFYKRFFISLLFIVLTILTIFFTGCRGAYIGIFTLFLSIMYFAFVIIRKNFSKQVFSLFKKIAAILTAVTTLAIAFSPKILNRIASIFILRGDSSTSFRVNVYNSCIEMIADNPFLGIGVGNNTFREIYGLYMLSGFDALGAYSIPLEIFVESGVFAFVSFFVYILFLIYKSVKFIGMDTDIKDKIVVTSFVIMILCAMAHGLVDTVWFRPQLQFIFWVGIAILLNFLEKKDSYATR